MEELAELLKKLEEYRNEYACSYDISSSMDRLIADIERELYDED